MLRYCAGMLSTLRPRGSKRTRKPNPIIKTPGPATQRLDSLPFIPGGYWPSIAKHPVITELPAPFAPYVAQQDQERLARDSSSPDHKAAAQPPPSYAEMGIQASPPLACASTSSQPQQNAPLDTQREPLHGPQRPLRASHARKMGRYRLPSYDIIGAFRVHRDRIIHDTTDDIIYLDQLGSLVLGDRTQESRPTKPCKESVKESVPQMKKTGPLEKDERSTQHWKELRDLAKSREERRRKKQRRELEKEQERQMEEKRLREEAAKARALKEKQEKEKITLAQQQQQAKRIQAHHQLPSQSQFQSPEEVMQEKLRQYDLKWKIIKTAEPGTIQGIEFPWPIFGRMQHHSDISTPIIREFLLHPYRIAYKNNNRSFNGLKNSKPITTRSILRAEMLKWHPDKFNTKYLPALVEGDRLHAQEIAEYIASALTEILGSTSAS